MLMEEREQVRNLAQEVPRPGVGVGRCAPPEGPPCQRWKALKGGCCFCSGLGVRTTLKLDVGNCVKLENGGGSPEDVV